MKLFLQTTVGYCDSRSIKKAQLMLETNLSQHISPLPISVNHTITEDKEMIFTKIDLWNKIGNLL